MPRPLRWMTCSRWTRPVLAALALAVAGSAPAAGQQRAGVVTVSGTVVDAQSGQGIAGVLVEATPGQRRAVTDAEGRFQLRLRAGGSLLQVSHLGYAAQQQTVAAQADVPEPLVFSLQPQPVVLERLHVVLDRFEARRNSVAMSSRVLDRRHLTRVGGHSLVQAVASAAVPLVPCSEPGALNDLWLTDGTSLSCVYSRGRVIAPAVYIDDMRAFGGMDELGLYSPSEAHHVEVYGMGRMIRVYTMDYVESVATGRRPLRSFADWRCNAC
ncbi:MAG TPA: carboxypeptidase regulatory-like domain-containing protein [Longimicrobium sp.]|nr:carboxypeptidase regulatory-like domain-containing protein [Longimicrobium sp.]